MRRGDFRGGAAGGIYFTSIMFRLKAKAAHFVYLGKSVPSGPSKTSLASAERPEAASIARKEKLPILKKYFFNLFRTAVSLHRLVMAIVCKLCPREKLPPDLYKSGGKGLALFKKFYIVIYRSNASDVEFAYE